MTNEQLPVPNSEEAQKSPYRLFLNETMQTVSTWQNQIMGAIASAEKTVHPTIITHTYLPMSLDPNDKEGIQRQDYAIVLNAEPNASLIIHVGKTHIHPEIPVSIQTETGLNVVSADLALRQINLLGGTYGTLTVRGAIDTHKRYYEALGLEISINPDGSMSKFRWENTTLPEHQSEAGITILRELRDVLDKGMKFFSSHGNKLPPTT